MAEFRGVRREPCSYGKKIKIIKDMLPIKSQNCYLLDEGFWS
jgi:hypothetical protein